MAANVTQSALLKRLGPKFEQAFQSAKGEVLEVRRDLPGGIKNGIARLVDCKFDEHKDGANKGKVFFYAAASVLEPAFFNDGHRSFKIEGLRTSITEPIYDTPNRSRKTLEEHAQWVTKMLGLLYGRPLTDFNEGTDMADVVALLLEEQPFISFETSTLPQAKAVQKGKSWFVVQNGRADVGPFATQEALKEKFPNIGGDPMIYHSWGGRVDYTSVVTEAVQDNSTLPTNGSPPETEAARVTNRLLPRGVQRSTTQVPEPSPAEEPEIVGDIDPSQFDEFGDLDSLAERADAQDAKAQDQLKAIALKAGISEEDFDASKTFQDAKEMILNVGKTDGGEERIEEGSEGEPEPEPRTIKKEDIWMYQVPTFDGKTKRWLPAKKAVECEVMSVNVKERTCTLKVLDTGKIVSTAVDKAKKPIPLSVSWDDLENGE